MEIEAMSYAGRNSKSMRIVSVHFNLYDHAFSSRIVSQIPQGDGCVPTEENQVIEMFDMYVHAPQYSSFRFNVIPLNCVNAGLPGCSEQFSERAPLITMRLQGTEDHSVGPTLPARLSAQGTTRLTALFRGAVMMP
jgi:hypothetical protein